MSQPGIFAMDIGTEGPMTARDARLAVQDCKAAIAHANDVRDSAVKFWEGKIERIQARCNHENAEPATICPDCKSLR